MITCYLCQDTIGPWANYNIGFICEDCEEALGKEYLCTNEKRLNLEKTKQYLQEQQTKQKK